MEAIARSGGGRATLARLLHPAQPQFPRPPGRKRRAPFPLRHHPGATVADAVRHGYQFNLPVRTVLAEREVAPLVVLENQAVVVEAVKAADDRSGRRCRALL